jgi:competence protein ComFC
MPLQLNPDTPTWRKFLSRTLDLFYPASCAICKVSLTEGRALCDACADDLPRLVPPFCSRCGEAFPGAIDSAFDCPNCSKLKFSFLFARPATVRDPRTLELIHRLKYGRELHLVPALGRLAAEAFHDPRLADALAEKWPLVPVPLHRLRFQNRHFNQAAEISHALSRHTGMPVLHALRRIRPTDHQTALTRSQRLKNLHNAFAISRQGKKMLAQRSSGAVLIDDVLTTGSTVDECAKILRRAGFHTVVVVTIMRG